MSVLKAVAGNRDGGGGGGGSVESVTGLNTNNTDPANPVVQISVDGVTITGAGTPESPLVAITGGSGDVTGPASSTDNAITRFDGTTGKIIQNSGASVDDSGNIAGNNLSGTNTGDQTTSGTSNRISVATGTTNPVIDIAATYVGQTSITTLGTVATGVWNATAISLGKGGTGSSLSDPGANTLWGWDDTDNTIGFWSIGTGLSYDHATHTLSSTGSGGTVTSVSGTSNRITSTGGATPVIDISASYAGQASLTTLGTITAGVWQGTKIGLTYGGTNADLSATGGASQVLRQSSTGAAITVSQLAASDLGNGTTGSGAVVLAGSPTITTAVLGSSTATTQSPGDNSTKLATTAYVQAAIFSGTTIAAGKYATIATLPTATYSNGASGVGATLTGVGLGALSIDGVTPSIADRILVKNQASTFQNGIYVVTTVGSVGAAFVLTRSSDYNTSADIDLGDTIFITAGNTLANTTWTQNGTENPVMGTDPITFAQTAGPGSYTAGNGISITGTSIAIDTSVTVDKTTAQTLTNKTLTAPVMTAPVLGTPTSGIATNLTGTASGLTAGSVTNATFTTALTVNTGTLTLTANAANTSVLTIGAGAVSVSGANTGDQTITLTGAVTGSGTGSFATTIATPGTLTVASTNSTATAHTHAVTSSSAPGAAASILATDSSGIIGSTGTRIVKGWFVDLTVTNAIAASITGSAPTLTTPRAIYGNNFDGSAALAQVIASTYGGTGNGFTKFSGAASTEKTYALPNASSTILTDNAAVTILQGGTGQTTANAALNAFLPTQTGNNGKYLTTDGSNSSWGSPAGSGTVTSVSVVSANGFAGSVATSTSTPAITISTSITGVLKGNGTAISAATAGTDYAGLGNTQTFSARQTMSGGLYLSAGAAEEAYFDNGNSGSSKTIAWDNGNLQKVTLSASCTFTFTAPTNPGKFTLFLVENGTGNFTITLPTIKWPSGTIPTWVMTANAINILSIIYDGSTYFGVGNTGFA